jgi:hypothetical protein
LFYHIGDVDMFGHEGVQTLTERKQKLNKNLALIKEVKERLQNSKTDEFNRIEDNIDPIVSRASHMNFRS